MFFKGGDNYLEYRTRESRTQKTRVQGDGDGGSSGEDSGEERLSDLEVYLRAPMQMAYRV